MNNSTQNTALEQTGTENDIAKTSEMFLDETLLYKTDIENYEVIIIIRPKELSKIKNRIENPSNWCQDYTSSDELFTTIIDSLRESQHIEKILFLQRENVLHIWSVISDYQNEAIRKEIYAKEKLLMENLSKRDYNFDFYLIEPDESSEVISSGAIVIYDKKG